MSIKAVEQRDAFRRFMRERSLKPHPWAKKAGIRSSTLYNFLAGKSASLSSDTLQRLAVAAESTIDAILSGAELAVVEIRPRIRVVARIGILGRVFAMSEEECEFIDRPAGIRGDVDAVVARVDSNALHPLPGGWMVIFEPQARDPEALLKKLCVVTVKSSGQRFVREVRRGSTSGLYTLVAWGAEPLEDVELSSAHLVLSLSQP